MSSALTLVFVIGFIILSVGKFKLHPFFALIFGSLLLGFLNSIPSEEILHSFQEGFGSIMSNIGMIVILGSVLGSLLENSGALKRLGKFLSDKGGSDQAFSMNVLGSIVSIPVFCDSGFIILSPLPKIIAKLKSKSHNLLVVSLAGGLYTSHCLVIPTPGPLAAATSLGASEYLGLVMLVGVLFLVPMVFISTLTIKWIFRNWTSDESENSELYSTDENVLPSLTNSIIPLIMPIILIGLGTFLKIMNIDVKILQFICHPIIAMMLSILTGYLLLFGNAKSTEIKWIEKGIEMAGPVLVITAAGGILGNLLKKTPSSESFITWISENPHSGIIALIFGFGLSALLKTMQGSSTTAMVIASSVMAPLIATAGFDEPIEVVLLIMSICGGAMVISHINDSYFWVINQYGNIPAEVLLKSFTILSLIQGFSVLFLSVAGFLLSQNI